MHTFDFNAIKKQTMKVTMPDKKRTVVNIGFPKKKVMDRFLVVAANINSMKDDEASLDIIYEIATDILNVNTSGVTFDVSEIKTMLELDDLIYFIQAYSKFIKSVSDVKN